MDTCSSDVSTVIDPRSIADLPLGNRRTLTAIGATVALVSYGNTPGSATPTSAPTGSVRTEHNCQHRLVFIIAALKDFAR